ncbi:MAG: hypothetical protein MSO56_10885 [Clostridiales bacterium]|nr:hypothetical protein [Clostridiales bacterium]
MESSKRKLILDPNASETERRFAVELAQLIGFCSISLEFPVAQMPEDPRDDDTLYFAVGTVPTGENVIPVAVTDDPASVWTQVYEQYPLNNYRMVPAPQNYVSATANAIRTPEAHRTGGLELLFEKDWLLRDLDGDGLPDQVDCYLVCADTMEDATCRAACDLAARFGMETTAVRYPLLLDADNRISHVVEFLQNDSRPAVTLVQEQPRKHITIEGRGQNLMGFLSHLANVFPQAAENQRIQEVFEHLQRTLARETWDGQAASLEAFGGTLALLCADADLEQFQKRWPQVAFHHANEGYVAEVRSYDIPWELDEVRELLERGVWNKVRAGNRIHIEAALWQDRETREAFARTLQQRAASLGAEADVSVLCAYKQGLSWLEEDFAPHAAASGPIERVQIFFDPHSDSALRYEHSPIDWQQAHEKVGKPPRWLQELYPADELVAEVLGISSDDVTFSALPEEPPVTYEARALDANGRCLYQDTYTVPVCGRNFLDLMPELGAALPSAGYLRVYCDDILLLDRQIETDCDKIWNCFQEELLPWLHDLAKEQNYAPEQQPFFTRLEVEVGIGGPERELHTRTDHISSGEMLEDAIHQVGQQSFMFRGRSLWGKSLDAPGLILPRIHVRPGKPELKATLYLPYGKQSGKANQNISVFCKQITMVADKLELFAESALSESERPLAAALMSLTEEGFTKLSKMLAGYGQIHLDGYSANLPIAEAVRPLPLEQVDLMSDCLVGYDSYVRTMEKLRRVPELKVYEIGRSYQGRAIYAAEPALAHKGYISRVKRLQHRPTVLINGRHHSNEVSATNAIFAYLRDLCKESVAEEVNIILIPMENVDGAALHDELQKEHPSWQHQVCYTNSLGADLMPHYYILNTIHTEAKVFADVTRRMLPDAFIDLHGVPHHDISYHFGMLEGYRGLWLPQAMLCAFYFHVDDPRFASNKVLSQAWKAWVSSAYEGQERFSETTRAWRERFAKYSWNGKDEFYASQWDGNMLNYWVPSPYNPDHPYPTVRWPWLYSVMFTAEAADETAHGAWLKDCAEAHLTHVRAGVRFLQQTRMVTEESVWVKNGQAHVACIRQRPLLPPED